MGMMAAPLQDAPISAGDILIWARVEQALAGELQDWQGEPEGWLATLLLLDQLPRMIFRDTPNAFAGDSLARTLALHGLSEGWDQQLRPIQRLFAYLVLEHAEDLTLQNQAVQRFQVLLEQVATSEHELFAGYLDYAERHQRVIARFGRFPHRGRTALAPRRRSGGGCHVQPYPLRLL